MHRFFLALQSAQAGLSLGILSQTLFERVCGQQDVGIERVKRSGSEGSYFLLEMRNEIICRACDLFERCSRVATGVQKGKFFYVGDSEKAEYRRSIRPNSFCHSALPKTKILFPFGDILLKHIDIDSHNSKMEPS